MKMNEKRKQLLKEIREYGMEVGLTGFRCHACISGFHETHLLVKPEGSKNWEHIKHLGKDSVLSAEGDLQTLLMQAEGELAVATVYERRINPGWQVTVERLQDMFDAAMYKDQQ